MSTTTPPVTGTLGALLAIHAQTPMHAGAGTALGTVDLPIQREKHTHWPNIAGSTLKGILRDACRERLKVDHQDELGAGETRGQTPREKANRSDAITTAFGPATADADKHAGAIAVTDARLLAFPVGSLKGVFAYVTCPEALDRLLRDARLAGFERPFNKPVQPGSGKVYAPDDSPCVFKNGDVEQLILEEYGFTKEKPVDKEITNWIASYLLTEAVGDSFKKRLLIVSDDDFSHFARHSTEVTARIGLDYDTKTVKNGALFYQEFLSTKSLLYAVVLAHPSRRGSPQTSDAAAILKTVADSLPPVLQIGGDETTGKGFCSVRLVQNNDAKGGAQ